MIKIPKSLDELKKMVSDTNVTDILDKVKSTFSDDEQPEPAVVDDDYQAILARMIRANKEQADCLKSLKDYINGLHAQIQTHAATVDVSKPEAKVSETDKLEPTE